MPIPAGYEVSLKDEEEMIATIQPSSKSEEGFRFHIGETVAGGVVQKIIQLNGSEK